MLLKQQKTLPNFEALPACLSKNQSFRKKKRLNIL